MIVSVVFEPMMMVGTMVFFAGMDSGLRGASLTAYVTFVALFVAVIGFARLQIMKTKKTNWDVSDRKKRLPLFILLLAANALFAWVVSLWHTPALTQFFWMYFWWFVGFFAITTFMKLSGHVAVITLACTWVIWSYGPAFLPLYVFIPLVAWSRVTLKRHTWAEVIVGFLYSVVFCAAITLYV